MTRRSHTTASIVDEIGNHCFGCGSENPQGLHLHFVIDPDAVTATCKVTITRLHQGPPGYVHGGIIATLLDEAMSKLNRPLNVLAMTRHLSVDYLRPVPIDTPLTLVSRHLRREGRKLFHGAHIEGPDAKVLAKASGLFVVVPVEAMASGASQID